MLPKGKHEVNKIYELVFLLIVVVDFLQLF